MTKNGVFVQALIKHINALCDVANLADKIVPSKGRRKSDFSRPTPFF